MFIAKLVLAVILTELLTELVVKSEIFKPLRKKLPNYVIPFHDWMEELLSCGYCFSVWVAAGVVILLQLVYNLTGWYLVDLALMSLIVHRLSNYLHNFNDKWLDKYYDAQYINTEKED